AQITPRRRGPPGLLSCPGYAIIAVKPTEPAERLREAQTSRPRGPNSTAASPCPMTQRVYNFTAGPAMLPLPVMQRVHEEFFDFQGLGASVIEISHRSPEFEKLLFETEDLVRELLALPKNYKVLFCHGGG